MASAAAFAAGCSTAPNDVLLGDMDPNSLAADGNTQHHFQDPNSGDNGITDPNSQQAEDQTVGSPEVVARLHSCSKITYAALGNILKEHGVNTGSTQTNSAGMLYKGGASALGTANYAGRVPEMIRPSTAALSKEFDILVAASQEIQAASKGGTLSMTSCTGTQLVDSSGNFTKDGLTCLMGKPATADHISIANDAITQAQAQGLTKDQGQQIAIAAILEAADTCE
ncbi:MAG TPA: hypothetical protein VGH28_30270 [Polyangiaceae bacterium]